MKRLVKAEENIKRNLENLKNTILNNEDINTPEINNLINELNKTVDYSNPDLFNLKIELLHTINMLEMDFDDADPDDYYYENPEKYEQEMLDDWGLYRKEDIPKIVNIIDKIIKRI